MRAPTRFEWTRRPGIGPSEHVLGDLRGRLVVEIGCGSGHNLAHLVEHHEALGIGIDHDPRKIERAERFYGHLRGIAFRRGDAAEQLADFAPGSIELCVSIFGAFSFTDPRPLLTATARVLRPGGRLAVTLREDETRDRVIILTRKDSNNHAPHIPDLRH